MKENRVLKVINIVELEDHTWLQCESQADGQVCATRIYGPTPVLIANEDAVRRPMRPGDALWWQGRYAFWTPLPSLGVADLVLPRFGYSHEMIPRDVFERVVAGAVRHERKET